MKKGRLILFWILTVIIISIVLLFLSPHEKISNIIQGIAIITLVFVTWFYAKQTQGLVEQQKAFLEQEKLSLEEEKNKRYAEFGEKRIEKFLHPILDKLQNIEKMLNGMQFNMDNAHEIMVANRTFIDFDRFRFKNSYMATFSLTQKLLEFTNQVKESWITGEAINDRRARERWRDDYLRKMRRITKSVNDEFRDIMIHLRKTYGYFSGEEELKKER